ncbi:jg2316 [Pararge aegeria aegeria]|uniref:Jg2316 protein n=1 Tax=Pararge aegeria aegeria TaxID=348720 RepID=A0A8S4SAG1_9NEOP|nr:jg2316 [Pararge aegeria aegeria]
MLKNASKDKGRIFININQFWLTIRRGSPLTITRVKAEVHLVGRVQIGGVHTHMRELSGMQVSPWCFLSPLKQVIFNYLKLRKVIEACWGWNSGSPSRRRRF